MGAIRKAIAFIWKTLAGTILCQFSLTSILVVGWTYRLMQRSALKRWWSMSPARFSGTTFAEFLSSDATTREHQRFPNWVVRSNAITETKEALREASGLRGKFRALRRGMFGSLWRNAVVGFQGIANTWVLTFLPTLFWVFGWYSGWDNSFNKGYEQFSVGIILSWIGIGLFILAMLYVPMAQARQAVTGEWRRFYEFRTVRRLIKRRRMACLLLAACFSLLSIPLSILKTAPYFVQNDNPEMEAMTDAQLLEWLISYFFWVSAVGFVLFVAIRLLMTRVYAGALVEAVQAGDLALDELGEFEREALARLELSDAKERSPRHLVVRAAGFAARPFWAAGIGAATIVVWFTFIAQIYVSEFVNYHPRRGFMNQPLVQLPWLRYVPDHLREGADASVDSTTDFDASLVTNKPIPDPVHSKNS